MTISLSSSQMFCKGDMANLVIFVDHFGIVGTWMLEQFVEVLIRASILDSPCATNCPFVKD